MKLLHEYSVFESVLWMSMGVLSIFLFFAAVMILALLIRQKRYKLLWLGLPLFGLSYFSEQCFDAYLSGNVYSQTAEAVSERFAALPDWLPLLLLTAFAMIEILLFLNIRRYEKRRITTMSVKEATDSLPIGICWYEPSGMVLLVNHTMEEFCEKTTGDLLLSGQDFCRRLYSGELRVDCQTMTVGGDTVILLADNAAYKIRNERVFYGNKEVCMLLALNISEAYLKTLELQKKQEKVEALGRHLSKVNQEIVALTAEREILNAKVKMHDELGMNLLSIKRFILNGGSEQEKAALLESLGHNLAFLKNARSAHARDEYELMLETARRLGVSVTVDGELPQTEPHKHILATAIHECFTNTLRHAQGDMLFIHITYTEDRIITTFENNGKYPLGEIEEKGGLLSLRTLTEQAGGHMIIRTTPTFAVVLELQKEVGYAL